MARGGFRPGAGRKEGSATARTREIANRAIENGLTPLEYMLGVMRDPKADVTRRDEMARAAAPYIHPRLAAVQHSGANAGPIQVEYNRDELIKEIEDKLACIVDAYAAPDEMAGSSSMPGLTGINEANDAHGDGAASRRKEQDTASMSPCRDIGQ